MTTTETYEKAAREAAASATDAHGAGNEPSAEFAYQFICEVWDEADAVTLPDEMPAAFKAAYDALVGRSQVPA